MREHDEEDVIFQVPIPPGAPPPPFPGVPPHAPNMVYVRHREVGGEERESEDLMLRKVPRETAMRFRAAAGGRAMTHAQYLTALASLHESMRALADDGHEGVKAELERLGLTTVTV